jgi:Fur family ferric uptake transcriptional regulator
MVDITMNTINKIKDIFSVELEKRGLRKTVERFKILEAIYARTDHFDVEELYLSLREENFHVSRATVYNTLDTLIDCGLVRKHHFGGDGALFEKALGYRQHGHVVCINCNRIQEFCDPRLQTIRESVGNIMDININDQALIFYGTCKHGCNSTSNSSIIDPE